MSIWQFAHAITPVEQQHHISLGEGNTPLLRSRQIGPDANLNNLFFKIETNNPSGSYKDRFAAAAIATMRQQGKTQCLGTSSGNTGAALAAYAAAAGMACHIVVIEQAPTAKLRQIQAYGATVTRIQGFGVDPNTTTSVFEGLKRLGASPQSALQISAYAYSPEGMTGVETISHELANQAAQPIQHVFAPAGGGGLCLALARGFSHIAQTAGGTTTPAIHVVQPAGNDTIATPLRTGAEQAQPVASLSDISGLQVPNIIDGHSTLKACRATGGTGHTVDDTAIWETQRRLAREEGIFTEPAGAVALTGALQAAANGEIDPDAMIVCLVTGSGFKDEPALQRMSSSTEIALQTWSDFQETYPQ